MDEPASHPCADKTIVALLWTTMAVVPLLPLLTRFLPAEKIYLDPLLLKAISLRIIAFFLVISWLLKLLFSTTRPEKNNLISILIIVSLLSGLFSSMFSILPLISFNGERASLTGFQSIVLAMIFFYSAFRIGTKKDMFLLMGLICSMLMISIFGALEYLAIIPSNSFQTINRLESTFTGPISFGAHLALVFPITLALLFSRLANKKVFLPVLLTFFFSLLTLMMTTTLSAWAACLVGAGLFLLFRLRAQGKVTTVRSKLSLILVLLLVIVIAVVSFNLPFYQNKTTSLAGRVIIWKIALQIVRDHSLFGSGEDTFLFLAPHYQQLDWRSISPIPSSTRFAHNHFLQTASTQGVFGFFSLMLLLVLTLLVFLDRTQGATGQQADLSIILACGVFAYVFYLLFGWSDLDTTIVFWIILGLFYGLLIPAGEKQTGQYVLVQRLLTLVPGAIALVLVSISIWSGMMTLVAERYFLQSLRSSSSVSWQNAVAPLNKAIRLNPTEWRYHLLKARFYSLPPFTAASLGRSQEELEKCLRINPYDYDALNLMITVLRAEEQLGIDRRSELEQALMHGKSIYPLHPAFSGTVIHTDQKPFLIK